VDCKNFCCFLTVSTGACVLHSMWMLKV
jgi:hypothetical protein